MAIDSDIQAYFKDKIDRYGATPRGADWNSTESQQIRFQQLLKIIDNEHDFSILDYGCGYGALADYLLANSYKIRQFWGFDILPDMINHSVKQYAFDKRFFFTDDSAILRPVDYLVASGIFNVKLTKSDQSWIRYVYKYLDQFNLIATKGFAVNFLTSYSDPDHKKQYLYYANPCTIFDHCKKCYSRNVSILHDYDLYDFTILVRK